MNSTEKKLIKTMQKLTDMEMCDECGWNCGFEQCHAKHASHGGCKYMYEVYNISFDEDADVIVELKESVKNALEKQNIVHRVDQKIMYTMEQIEQMQREFIEKYAHVVEN